MAYTEEQVKDIQEREKKGLELLKDLQLNPSASVQKVNMGNDMFVDKVTPFLADTKYTPVPSVTSDEVKKDEHKEETK